MSKNAWEQLGKEDPYFGVCTGPQFRKENLNAAAFEEFFQSGEDHVAGVLQKLQNYFQLSDLNTINNVLDLGCGTGRLVIPFAQRFKHVTGIDISQHILDEAQKNCAERNITNVSLLQSSDISTLNLPGKFDFVHTFIVLQHIPVETGYRIIDTLLSLAKEGGYGMIHFTYDNNKSSFKTKIAYIKGNNSTVRKVLNFINRRAINTPAIQMNNYDLKKVFSLIRKHSIKQVSADFTDHGGYYGMCLYFKK